jgi:nicotinamide-nucleotide amidase
MMVREHYARRFPNRRLQLTKPRLKMASIPSGGIAVRNPVGTAPGVRLSARGVEMFCLPGVPKEAKAIFRDSVSRAIHSRTGGAVFDERWVHVRGIMESSLAPMIDQVMNRWPDVYIKSHPRGIEGGVHPHIELHFSIHTSDKKKAERALLNAVKDLTGKLDKAGGLLSSRH